MKFILPCILILMTFVSCSSPQASSTSAEAVNQDTLDTAIVDSLIDTLENETLEPKEKIPFWNAGIEEGEYNGSWYAEEEGMTTFRYPGIKFRIDGVFRQKEDYIEEDSLYLVEDVGWYIEGRRMWVESEDETDQFQVSLSVHQIISELPPEDFNTDPEFNWQKWEKNSLRREERSQFYQLEDSSNYYRLPWTHEPGGFFYDKFIEKYDYDSTYQHIPGEMGGLTATYLIGDKACMWTASFGVIRIRRINAQGIKSDYFFKIFYSYGC